MKTKELIEHLERNGWRVKRYGEEQDLYGKNGQRESIVRCGEADEELARAILKRQEEENSPHPEPHPLMKGGISKVKCAYPIVMTEGSARIVVSIPDFHINTQGRDIPDAMEMARDAMGLMGIDMQDDGEALPEASNIATVQAEAPSGAIVSLVDIDFSEYRRKRDIRVVKKNCTIPSWLNFEAERAGVNFSALLQAALKDELNITNR